MHVCGVRCAKQGGWTMALVLRPLGYQGRYVRQVCRLGRPLLVLLMVAMVADRLFWMPWRAASTAPLLHLLPCPAPLVLHPPGTGAHGG